MTTASILLQIALGLGVPALIGLFAPRRWRVLMLILWILAPVLLLLVMAGVEAVQRPGEADAGKLFFGLMLIGSLLAVPWLLACLAGFGVGALLRGRGPKLDAPVSSPTPRPADPVAPVPRAARIPFNTALQPPSGWRPVHVGFERDGLLIDGLDIWALPWRPEDGPRIKLAHPAYPEQMHDFTAYAVDDGKTATRFAVAELSNGVWGFYRWIVPADAVEGNSADGSLRYTHGHGEIVEGRYDAALPTATLSDAATGALLFDGRNWASSRIVPQEDGALLLVLDQKSRQTTFRIDPASGMFQDLARPGPDRPLTELADAAAAELHASFDRANEYFSRRVAPDGSLLVELEAVEWFNSHWIQTPRVSEIATGRILLDLWGSDWDAIADFPRANVVRLGLESYRSRICFDVEIDLATGLYTVEGLPESGPVQALPTLLERESDVAYATRIPSQPVIARTTPRSYGVAALILVGTLAAIAAASYLTIRLSPAPPQKLDTMPAMPRLDKGEYPR
ncbi:hypothetical protein BH10PSE13_BH10PSE13_22290 [soil metagenome]